MLRAAGRIFLVFALASVVLCGCRKRASEQAGPPAKAYQLKGVVVATDAASGEVSINSEAIPGFMEAMIMPYKLAQPNIVSELHPGDHITARLLVSDSGSELDQIVITAQAQPDYKPKVSYNVPTAGQAVPNYKLLNQDGKTISIDQFRGKVLVVTFIYTRCPFPDFCIRMSRNFAELNQDLAADPKLDGKIHLLSISFDPTYDTPKVLRGYASGYVIKGEKQPFSRWDFAAPAPAELQEIEQFFNVGVNQEKDKTLTHSLSTVVIGPDGKIFGWFPTNDWKPSDLMKEISRAAGQGA